MFDNEELRNFEYRQFSSTNTLFNKKIYIDIIISESGKVESVNFPRKTNNLSPHEESELSYMYSQMERWQPLFSKNKAYKCTLHYETGMKIR